MRQPATLNLLAILLATGLLTSPTIAAPSSSSNSDPETLTPHIQLQPIPAKPKDRGITSNNKRTPEPNPQVIKAVPKVADFLADAAQKAQIDDIINKFAKTAADNAKSFIKLRRFPSPPPQTNESPVEKREPQIIKAAPKIADLLAEAAQKAQIDDLINKIAKSASDNAKSFIKRRRAPTQVEKRVPEPEPVLAKLAGEAIEEIVDIVVSDEAAKKAAKKAADAAAGLIKHRRDTQIAQIKKENLREKRDPIFGEVVAEVIEGLADAVVDDEAAKKAAEEAAKKIAKKAADAAAGLIKRRREEQIDSIKEENNDKRSPSPILGSAVAEVIEGLADVVVDDDAAKKAAEEVAKKIAKKGQDAAQGLIKRLREEQIAEIKAEMEII